MNTKTNPITWWEEMHGKASMLSKWIALYEAVNIVSDKAEERGVSPEKIVYKPKAIRDYITATEDIILKKILMEDYNIDVCYSEENSNDRVDIKIIQ
jgi:hypothetical protein